MAGVGVEQEPGRGRYKDPRVPTEPTTISTRDYTNTYTQQSSSGKKFARLANPLLLIDKRTTLWPRNFTGRETIIRRELTKVEKGIGDLESILGGDQRTPILQLQQERAVLLRQLAEAQVDKRLAVAAREYEREFFDFCVGRPTEDDRAATPLHLRGKNFANALPDVADFVADRIEQRMEIGELMERLKTTVPRNLADLLYMWEVVVRGEPITWDSIARQALGWRPRRPAGTNGANDPWGPDPPPPPDAPPDPEDEDPATSRKPEHVAMRLYGTTTPAPIAVAAHAQGAPVMGPPPTARAPDPTLADVTVALPALDRAIVAVREDVAERRVPLADPLSVVLTPDAQAALARLQDVTNAERNEAREADARGAVQRWGTMPWADQLPDLAPNTPLERALVMERAAQVAGLPTWFEGPAGGAAERAFGAAPELEDVQELIRVLGLGAMDVEGARPAPVPMNTAETAGRPPGEGPGPQPPTLADVQRARRARAAGRARPRRRRGPDLRIPLPPAPFPLPPDVAAPAAGGGGPGAA